MKKLYIKDLKRRFIFYKIELEKIRYRFLIFTMDWNFVNKKYFIFWKLYKIVNVRYGFFTEIKNHCFITYRGSGYFRKFGLSRIKLRELILEGYISGVRKSLW